MKVSKKQHEQTSTRLPVVRVRRRRGGKRREQKSGPGDLLRKNGSNRSGLGRGQHQQLRSRSPPPPLSLSLIPIPDEAVWLATNFFLY